MNYNWALLIPPLFLVAAQADGGLKPPSQKGPKTGPALHSQTLAVISEIATQENVPSKLLAAICWQESHYNVKAYVHQDGHTLKPSVGVCQIQYETAKNLGFIGKLHDLFIIRVNIRYAAKYLRYQLDRYGNNWELAAAAYNSGSVHFRHGKIRNVKYVNKVKQALEQL